MLSNLIKIIKVKSSIDGSIEESFFIPSKKKNAPVIVVLHTWSFHKEKEIQNIKYIFKRTGWNVLCPEFRGPNLKDNPRVKEACASKPAKQDIIDAINYIKRNFKLKGREIFLLGGSGGGHMALMMAAYKPALWTAICAWCPLTDLLKFEKDNKNYRQHVKACCKSLSEYKKRSPVNYSDKIARAKVFIFHGKDDKSVHFTHSLNLYNKIIKRHLEASVFLSIFKGGHEIDRKESIRIFKGFVIDGGKAYNKLTK